MAYITKVSHVKYNAEVVCERWEQFISEIMCGDTDTAKFLQKAQGYAISGDTSLECFFILYGASTRNLKGARMVNIPELEKDMELNTDLVNQLTGRD